MKAPGRVLSLLLVGGLAVAMPSVSSAAAGWQYGPQADVKGAADHPLVGRFQGSYLVQYSDTPYDEVTLTTGPIEWIQKKATPKSAVRLAGRITRLGYMAPPGRSTLEIMANLRAGLARRGWKPTFECVGADQRTTPDRCGAVFVLTLDRLFENMRSDTHSVRVNGSVLETMRYAIGTATYAGKSLTIAVLVAASSRDRDPGKVFVYLVEPRSLDTNQVDFSLTADMMLESIKSDGRVAVYGVLFDSDKAAIKPDSAPALAEIAKALKASPQLKVYVVGHTDNSGTLERNLALSQERANSVVQALVSQHGISQNRLAAKGVAQFAPVATNETDAGRAQNRRVEIVRQ
jgi:OmpA-OmpF porin, OOP family